MKNKKIGKNFLRNHHTRSEIFYKICKIYEIRKIKILKNKIIKIKSCGYNRFRVIKTKLYLQ